jgi:hypothetical protein
MRTYAAMERRSASPKGHWYTEATAKPSARQIADIRSHPHRRPIARPFWQSDPEPRARRMSGAMMLLSSGQPRRPSKTEFNGIGGLRTHIRIVPTPSGTFLPANFGPWLVLPPKPGPLLRGAPRTDEDKRQSARALARHGLARDIVI